MVTETKVRFALQLILAPSYGSSLDTQSWFHSQEVNLMVDSQSLVSEWLQGLNSNQNTLLYGKVSTEDGIWRDEDGREIEKPNVRPGGSGPIGRLKGLGGTLKKLRGTGGTF